MSAVGPIAAKKLQGRECNEVFLLHQPRHSIKSATQTDISPFAERALRNICSGSLRLDACGLHHLAPLLGFLSNKLPEVAR